MKKIVHVSIEQNPETQGFTVFVQHDSGWVAKLTSGVPLDKALAIVESDLEKLKGPGIEFRVGAERCQSVAKVMEALRVEATLHQRSETRLRAGIENPFGDEVATLPGKRGAS